MGVPVHFRPLTLDGVVLVELEKHEDERGYFARSYCVEEFARNGLDARVHQCNLSYNRRAGTLRGLHYQANPHGEIKLVRCDRGAVFDVVVDVRPDSATHGQWEAVELSQDNGRMLYISQGFAHGFQTLTDDCELHYQMSTPYLASAARGIRWDDSTLAIQWPYPEPSAISERDRALPLFDA